MRIVMLLGIVAGLMSVCSASAEAQLLRRRQSEAEIVSNATSVLTEAISTPGKAIPKSLLTHAQGVVIIPQLIKGGLIVGGRHGRGVVLVRDDQGVWGNPTFVTITGGSLGWQAGLSSNDLVLVFKTRESVRHLLKGKFTIGVDAAAAAGPVGRRAEAGTDANLSGELYSYARSRGLFLGVSLDGAVLSTDRATTARYYLGGQSPPTAVKLTHTLAAYSGGATLGPASAGDAVTPHTVVMPEGSIIPEGSVVPEGIVIEDAQPESPTAGSPPIRSRLAGSGRMASGGRGTELDPANMSVLQFLEVTNEQQWRSLADAPMIDRAELVQRKPVLLRWQALRPLLDNAWKDYFEPPAALFRVGPAPATEELHTLLQRFSTVAADDRYQSLTSRVEFRLMVSSLRSYLQSRLRDRDPLTLPPPPGR